MNSRNNKKHDLCYRERNKQRKVNLDLKVMSISRF